MPETIISDTSCIILLNKIGELELLHSLYSNIVTTNEAAREYGEPLPPWVEIKSAANFHYQQILELQIDKGEASAIALAIEMPESVLILDDYKARKIAENLGIEITGTIGVIVKAKIKGIIPSVIPILQKIKTTNFRLSEEIIQRAKIEAGEE